MSPRTNITRAIAVCALALGTGLVHSPVAPATPVPADTAAASSCFEPYQRGPLEETDFHWQQRVWYRVCPGDTGFTIEAYVNFGPLSGFNASHVTGCRAHFRLQGAPNQYKDNDCTAAAKTGKPFSSGRVSWSSLPYATYFLLDGWINIQTGVHYEGNPHSQVWVIT